MCSFVDWLRVSVCICMTSVCGVGKYPNTQFFLSLPLLNLFHSQQYISSGCTSIFDDSKNTTVAPTSMEHFLLSLQYSVQELFAN